jgi:hypothetical protein
MKLVDLNVLLYAINRDAAHHRAVHAWWERAVNGEEPIGLAWLVLLGFLRLGTHPGVFRAPLTAAQAIDHVDRWLAHPNVRVLNETDQHWRVLRELLGETGSVGNLTSDAHLAALALEHTASLVSTDADFARFPRLRWENPIRA